jgi:hypothetical protein
MLMSIFINYARGDARCGIPVLMWTLVHLSLFMLNSLSKLLQICVIRYCYRFRVHYNIGSALVVNLTLAGWLIYGNVLYFSAKNDCADISGTRGLASLMLFFLIIGYFQLMLFALILCVLPCLIYYISSLRIGV